MKNIFLFILFMCLTTGITAQEQNINDPLASSIDNTKVQSEIQQTNQSIETVKNKKEAVIKELNDKDIKKRAVTQNTISSIKATMEQNALATSLLTTQIEATEKESTQNKQICLDITSEIQKSANPLSSTQDNDTDLQKNLKLCQQQSEALSNKLAAEKKLLSEYKALNSKLKEKYQILNSSYLESGSNEAIKDGSNLIDRLKLERDHLLQVDSENSSNPNDRLNSIITLALINKQINLENLSNTYLKIESRVQELQFADFNDVSLGTLKKIQSEITLLNNQLLLISQQNGTDHTYIDQRYQLYSKQNDKIPASIAERYQDFKKKQKTFSDGLEKTQDVITIIQANLSQQYTAQSQKYYKQQFDFIGEWDKLPTLGTDLKLTINTFIGQYLVAFQTTWQSISNQTLPGLITLLAIFIAIFSAIAWLITLSNQKAQKYTKSKKLFFTSKLLLFFFSMLKKNLPYIGLLMLIFVTIKVLKIPSPSSNLLILLPIIMLLISIPYYAAKILIYSEILETTDHFPITRMTIIFTIINAFLFSFVLLAQWLINEHSMIDIFRWIYGFFILSLTYSIWKTIGKTKRYMNEYYNSFHTYRVLRLIISLLPFAFIIFAVASFLGFLNFAWLFAEYVIIAFCYSLIWVVALGILKDISLTFKRYVLANTNNSVFWAQDVINPLHAILRLSSLFFLIFCLMETYNWTAQTPIISKILKILNTPIFQNDTTHPIMLSSILFLIFGLYIVIRLGSWIKSFAYRLIFSKIIDTGIRNSLSVFSQYAVVTFGFLIALKVVGINLTAFTVFAGALGVGIGFGMQTIANNFISGLLLLIERPLRNGDIINVGGYYGTVERIGMRSLTITTFDNESVILPNSDFVTSAFRNWSHEDQIVRQTLYIDIGYQHSPNKVEAAFMKGLEQLLEEQEIVVQPPDLISAVYAYDYTERGIRYRVQFYVDLIKHWYLGSRHKVINRLWEICDQEGFEMAYPKHELFFPEPLPFQENKKHFYFPPKDHYPDEK